MTKHQKSVFATKTFDTKNETVIMVFTKIGRLEMDNLQAVKAKRDKGKSLWVINKKNHDDSFTCLMTVFGTTKQMQRHMKNLWEMCTN